MNKYIYLQDAAFLKMLDELEVKTYYVQLTVLTLENKPIGTIEGMATGGSISVNGSSAIRRSGSISIIADASNYRITDVNNIIYMNKKVQIEVGYKNTTGMYTNYDIIWLPLGIFVMSNANIQKNNQNITISLSLKDQMALLNGESGGTFETPVIHSPMQVEKIGEDGLVIEEEPALFYDLIFELVNKWGKIPKDFIIIDDVPSEISNIVRWIGKDSIELLPVKIGDLTVSYQLVEPSPTSAEDSVYSLGDSIGYMKTKYVYPTASDLTSNAGESIVSVLDKIKNALGNYEYFFDTQGYFRFQKIKNYQDSGIGIQDLQAAIGIKAYNYYTKEDHSVYDFNDAKIVTSYSNAPVWQNVKNDFVVWGKTNNNATTLRYHLIIDNIPNPSLPEVSIWQYQDAFGVYRFAATKEEADIKLKYAKTKIEQKKLDNTILLDSPREYSLPIENKWDWRLKAYFYSVLHNDAYFYSQELLEEIPKLYNLKSLTNISLQHGLTTNTITYWIDVIYDTSLEKFTVTNIGKRTKSINNDKINCLFEPSFPDVQFIEAGTALTAEQRLEYLQDNKAFYQMQEDNFQNLAIGIATNSAYEHLRAQLHTLLSFNESVSINVLPVYHLEPNTCITIEDEDTNIHGDYMIKSFTLPLAANGSMTIQCSKAVQRI